MPSEPRSTSPEGSFHGMPVSGTRPPRAADDQQAGARADAQTARRPRRFFSHTRQALASESRLDPHNKACPRRSPRSRCSTGDTQVLLTRCGPISSEQALIKNRVRIELALLAGPRRRARHQGSQAVSAATRKAFAGLKSFAERDAEHLYNNIEAESYH